MKTTKQQLNEQLLRTETNLRLIREALDQIPDTLSVYSYPCGLIYPQIIFEPRNQNEIDGMYAALGGDGWSKYGSRLDSELRMTLPNGVVLSMKPAIFSEEVPA